MDHQMPVYKSLMPLEDILDILRRTYEYNTALTYLVILTNLLNKLNFFPIHFAQLSQTPLGLLNIQLL